MTFGGTHPERYGDCSEENAFAMLNHFYDNGGNFFDTANVYQDGLSEVWLGEWIDSCNNRDELALATNYTSGYKLHCKDAVRPTTSALEPGQ
jgi:aryl-alcohol dehydrogenase-like predicted oxidoreductase